MTPVEVLGTVFPAKPDDLYILIWHNNPIRKTSRWFTDPAAAGKFAWHRPNEAYVGVALAPDPRTLIGGNGGSIATVRCKADQTMAIPGLWVDLDIDHPAASKQCIPDIHTALGMVKGRGWDPSLIVNSGYGLHCWWLFKELWIFESDVDRQRAAQLELRLIETLRRSGHHIDSTHDLSRVLRIPGTNNCKHDKQVKVVLLEDTGRRYDPADLNEVLVAVGRPVSAEMKPAVSVALPASEADVKPMSPVDKSAEIKQMLGGLVFNENAVPDPLKYTELK